MAKVLGIVLILASLGLGYFGYQGYQEATNKVEIGSVELSANDSDARTNSLIMLGGAVVLLVAGIYVVRK